MEWFRGSVAEAVAKAKTENALFAVYIQGKDELSSSMDKTWDNEDVAKLCKDSSIVALKLEAQSESCVQFSQIYPVVCVPCSYFIGSSGVPLEVAGGVCAADEFIAKINSAVQKHNASPAATTPTVAASTAPSTVSSTAPPASVSQSASSGASGGVGSFSDDEELPQTQPATTATTTSTVATAATANNGSSGTTDKATAGSSGTTRVEDRIEKAKELMAKKRAEKAAAEKEKEKLQEQERRELGRGVTKLRQMQQEQDAKEAVQQMRKDREQDMIAKQRIKEQIAQDRAERAARFQKHKTQETERMEQKAAAKQEQEKEQSEKSQEERMKTANLQFRLPDGRSVTEAFPSDLTLQAAYDFIAQHESNTLRSFTLSTRYPKRVFGTQDMSSTLLDLQLAPSAIVIVLPSRSSGVSGSVVHSSESSGGLWSLIWLLVSPFTAIWSIISAMFSSQPSSSTSSQPAAMQQRPATGHGSDSGSSASSQSGTSGSSSGGARSRREGNLWRLKRDDDDNATYNGNSTQQM